MSTTKEHSNKTHLTFENMLKTLQIKANTGTAIIPAFYINPKTYASEISQTTRKGNYDVVHFFRQACKTGSDGTLKINVCVIPFNTKETYRGVSEHLTIKNSLTDMFCITTDNEVALKTAFDVSDFDNIPVEDDDEQSHL
jgi:hypothetical protein